MGNATQRVFTDAGLKELGQLTVDLLQKAIDSGDAGKAKTILMR
jgi:hypothetical protein